VKVIEIGWKKIPRLTISRFCFFFLEVVLMLSVRFPLRKFCTDGALWPIKGFSFTGPYLIGLPLVLISGGDVSISCRKNNDELIKDEDRRIERNDISKGKFIIPH
jgi:hypothetical protein